MSMVFPNFFTSFIDFFFFFSYNPDKGGDFMSDLGNKKIMAKNIRHYMAINNVTQTQVCNTLGFKMPTFSDWINAKTYPRIDKIELMANYFGITKADLVEEHAQEQKHNMRKGVVINVLGRVAAGIPIEAIEDVIDTEEITEELASTGEFFGLQIHGKSMEPRMKEGDIVIVRKQDDAESGDIVIAMVNGDEATCKKLIKHEQGISLVSFNSEFEPMYFTPIDIQEKPVKIIGRVVELRAKF